MSIAAYEAAKELKDQGKVISCWYLNTARRRIEVLVREPGNSQPDEVALFRISIEQYATVHNKVLTIYSRENTLPSEEKRLDFAKFLLQNNTYIKPLINLLIKSDDKTSVQNQISAQNKLNEQKKLPKPEYYTCDRSLDGAEKAILKKAENCGLIRGLVPTSSGWSFEISNQQNGFLKGGWLEFYVYNEIANIKENNGQPLFQDVGINRHVYNKRGQDYNHQEENELDVSMIYNAQLFIIECKVGKEVKKSETIFRLDSVANAFGGGFVGKYLVTALPKGEVIEKDRQKEGNKPDTEKGNIEERLEIRKIRLITLDELKNLKAIFREEAKNPQYPRI